MVDEINHSEIPKNEVRKTAAPGIDEMLGKNKKETEIDKPTVRLYRAVTGRGFNHMGYWFNKGITEELLTQYGVFNSNLSRDQYQFDAGMTRSVPGLPVSLNATEGVSWLEGKKYEKKPALIVLEIPLAFISGNTQVVKLVRNAEDSRNDFTLTEEMLKMHLGGENRIYGECFLAALTSSQPIPSTIRQFERILIPSRLNNDGSIDFSAGFEELPKPESLS